MSETSDTPPEDKKPKPPKPEGEGSMLELEMPFGPTQAELDELAHEQLEDKKAVQAEDKDIKDKARLDEEDRSRKRLAQEDDDRRRGLVDASAQKSRGIDQIPRGEIAAAWARAGEKAAQRERLAKQQQRSRSRDRDYGR